ncbi:MAG TPA: hypothetical protein VGR60_04520, partial [Gemmatimonadales bacterium]|nr:hypothetical protein [Gemmatimonadales bacterium]
MRPRSIPPAARPAEQHPRLPDQVRTLIADEIASAHGREVAFTATVDPDGVLVAVRAVARGRVD